MSGGDRIAVRTSCAAARGGACKAVLVAVIATGTADVAHAQSDSVLAPVVVTATRTEQRLFDVPASIDTIDGDALRAQQWRVNLSETLTRVPGLVVQNRQNYAQDLQVSSRGFGARATFGVRGVRLVQDGIPLTMPDGQGQTALVDLEGAGRIEVLRGPFAALYGNASGGVIQILSAEPPDAPTLAPSGAYGAHDTHRAAVRAGARGASAGFTLNLSRFETDGVRRHSAARRDLANATLRMQAGPDTRVTVIANHLHQPDTQDPLGLTQAQLDADPRQAGTNADAFDTRKSIDHTQGGVAVRHRLGASDTVELMGYGGRREVLQWLAIPVAAQGPTSSGGVVDLDRRFGGTSVQWRHAGQFAARPYDVVLGMQYDRMAEVRTGFVNAFGVRGALRREETDRVDNLDQTLIANWDVSTRWRVSGGVRHSRVSFAVDDRYVTAVNPDDSGDARYRHTAPVLGALFRVTAEVEAYGSVGTSFETPTFTELAYRPDLTPGLNLGLAPAKSRNAELGVRARFGKGARASAALFYADTRDEVVSATSSGGRNTFANAPRTRREGFELSGEAPLGAGFDVQAAYTVTRARFREYVSMAGVDLAGASIPGVPRSVLHGEVRWSWPRAGFVTAIEAHHSARVFANDTNTAAASSYTTVNWRAGIERRVGPVDAAVFARVENLFDRRYVGSVVVNEGNQRYFEPAPALAAMVGIEAGVAF